MSKLKALGVLVLALFALSAVAASAASAESGLLPGPGGTKLGYKIKSTSKVALLETVNKEKIECTTSESSGKLEGKDSHINNVPFDFHGCLSLGFPVESLGDLEGLILFTAESVLICPISDTHWLFIVHLPSGGVHLEILSLGVLLVVTGLVAALTLTIKGTEFITVFEQKEGKPVVKEDPCAKAKLQLLSEKNHNKEPIEAAEAAEGTFTFEEKQELML